MSSSPNPFDLKGKIALVTGASRGIGEAIAHCLAAQGAMVALNGRKPEGLQKVADSIRAAGGEAHPFPANVGHAEEIPALVDRVLKHWGGLDILVNNAATNPVFGPVLETDLKAFDKIMDVNLKAPFLLAQAAFPHMRARGGGSILNISSIGGVTPEPGLAVYSVSKAALISLTKALAKEWGAAGIRVNAICPGLIKTEFSRALWQDEKMVKWFEKRVPLGRIGEPEELAGVALWLATDAGAYATGGVYMVDGGFTA